MPAGSKHSRWFYINKALKRKKRKRAEAAKNGWATRRKNQRKRRK